MARVIVVGAGVIGLTCAVRLLENGQEVAVLARDLPLETTSALAAGLWYPRGGLPFEQVAAWSLRSYEVFAELARHLDPGETGVVMRRGTELLRTRQPDPWWASAVPALSRGSDPPAPYVSGWSAEVPVVEMPVYLAWLSARVAALGGTLTRLALPGLPTGAAVVINAAGLGARLTASDHSVLPVRGQVVYLEQVGLDRWWLDARPPGAAGPTYVVPRSRDIVVGGTEDEGDWGRTPDEAVAKQILDRAVTLVPELGGARVLGHRVGLRPARPTVRLEIEQRGDGRVVHCYGHGGSGVTLSWGCAEEVARLVGSP